MGIPQIPDVPLLANIAYPSESLIARLAPLKPVPGLPNLFAHQARDVFELWQAWEEETGRKQDIPFWATVWPAALMTAKFIGQAPANVAGKTVVDLGCGSGIVGIAAMKAGALSVIANDIDPVALSLAGKNAEANGVTVTVDERNLLGYPPLADWDVILVADLFYEKSVADSMVRWLGVARGNGSVVYIADASRPFSPRSGVKILIEEKYPTDMDLEGSTERTVRLLAFQP
ncbi:MAG: 50S ribosomal protein L11 methyltransferase [Fibrobacterota bacterium]|nr:50S ribosomal protein L11 methyltransferase [Fibrobacterota bacterium]